MNFHDDVIKWKHFPRYWSFVRGFHRSPVISPHEGQGRRALIFSLICAWLNGRVNNGETGDLRRHAHYDVTVMFWKFLSSPGPGEFRGITLFTGNINGAILTPCKIHHRSLDDSTQKGPMKQIQISWSPTLYVINSTMSYDSNNTK